MVRQKCSRRNRERLRLELGGKLWSTVQSTVAQHFFDAKQLVVLGHSIAAACRSSLDLSRVEGDCQVSDRRIFGFTTSVTRHGSVVVTTGQVNRVNRFG